jgi:hypothetical protein
MCRPSRNLAPAALAVCFALVFSHGSAQPLDQQFAWQGHTLTVPVACFDAELGYIVLTPANTALCSELQLDLIDAFNFALADDNPANNPVPVIEDDLGDVGPLTTGSIQ